MKIHKCMTTFSILVTYMCVGLWIPKYTFTTYSVFMLFIYLYMPKIISEEKSIRAREREFSVRLSPRK